MQVDKYEKITNVLSFLACPCSHFSFAGNLVLVLGLRSKKLGSLLYLTEQKNWTSFFSIWINQTHTHSNICFKACWEGVQNPMPAKQCLGSGSGVVCSISIRLFLTDCNIFRKMVFDSLNFENYIFFPLFIFLRYSIVLMFLMAMVAERFKSSTMF